MEHTPRPHEPQAESLTEPRVDAPNSEALGPGSILGERYRLVRCIGEGGMGSIWQADHLALDTTVAVKLIRRAQVDDERARTRFLHEARAAASLRSPHVVQIFDYGLHGNVPYIVMELLDGESLADHLARRGALTPAETFAILSQVARAIERVHDAGLVHRDLKPDNIFLATVDAGRGEPVAKLLDFGIAKRALDDGSVATTTSVGGVLGTPYYMSPEQLIDASSADAQSDLWSLAIIAYECLVGERPFRSSGVAELAVAVLTEPRPVPSTRGDVPVGFDGWFLAATAREPSHRFADVRALVDRLAVALALDTSRSSVVLPIVDGGVVHLDSTHVPAKRRSAAAALFWIAALGGVVLGILALRRPDSPANPNPSGSAQRAADATTTPPQASTPASTPASESIVVPSRVALEPAEQTSPATTSVPTTSVPTTSAPTGVRRKPKKRPPARDTGEPRHDVKELEP